MRDCFGRGLKLIEFRLRSKDSTLVSRVEPRISCQNCLNKSCLSAKHHPSLYLFLSGVSFLCNNFSLFSKLGSPHTSIKVLDLHALVWIFDLNFTCFLLVLYNL